MFLLQDQTVEISDHEGWQKQIEENPHWSGQYSGFFMCLKSS